MIKNLTKHGNSWALIIDKPILDLLNIDPTAPVEITTDGQRLVLTAVREAAEEQKFQQSLEMIHQRFGHAMKQLAE